MEVRNFQAFTIPKPHTVTSKSNTPASKTRPRGQPCPSTALSMMVAVAGEGLGPSPLQNITCHLPALTVTTVIAFCRASVSTAGRRRCQCSKASVAIAICTKNYSSWPRMVWRRCSLQYLTQPVDLSARRLKKSSVFFSFFV